MRLTELAQVVSLSQDIIFPSLLDTIHTFRCPFTRQLQATTPTERCRLALCRKLLWFATWKTKNNFKMLHLWNLTF